MDLRRLVSRYRGARSRMMADEPVSSGDSQGDVARPGLSRRRVLTGAGAALVGLAATSLGTARPTSAASQAPALPLRVVRQPMPHDLVDNPVEVCGIGTGFEGDFDARVRDGNGRELSRVVIHAGGLGIWGNYRALLPLGGTPATAHGTVEVFELSAKDGSEIGKVIVPVVFGQALIEAYVGFGQHTVVRGETLSTIARRYYGAAGSAELRRLVEANRHQLRSPNQIVLGQVLRVPHSSSPAPYRS